MGKRKGCFNCSKRRIVCDMTEPHCRKCAKKGLTCSGLGIRYRFNCGIASRGKFKGKSSPVVDTQNEFQDAFSSEKEELSPIPEAEKRDNEITYASKGVPPALQALDSKTEFLFAHFSQEVASVMVAVDTEFNGYRTVVLPLACNYVEVRRAVCIVSALHLGDKMSNLSDRARSSRVAMILRLKRLVDRKDWDEILSLPHQVVILLLLVGEMITGGDDFSFLIKMLLSLNVSMRPRGANSDVYAFLVRQAHMVQLFGAPFLGEFEASKILSQGVESHCDWISYTLEHYPEPSHQAVVTRLIAAVRQASEIYMNCVFSPPSFLNLTSPSEHAPNNPRLESLKELVEDIQADTPGAPALVWVYLIGAADSRSLEDRKFFTEKLKGLYLKIGFKNIVVGLQVLRRLWDCHDQGRWTEHLANFPAFVM